MCATSPLHKQCTYRHGKAEPTRWKMTGPPSQANFNYKTWVERLKKELFRGPLRGNKISGH